MSLRILACAVLALTVGTAENWPQFRGPRGDGSSSESFTRALRQAWKVKLPGPGHSSPIVRGGRIFVTAFGAETSTLWHLAGHEGRLWVLSLHRANGRVEWQREVQSGAIEKTTSVNKPASPTPATDGERVYAYFGSFGLAAFTLEGKPFWETKLGPFPHHMGFGSSPLLSSAGILLNVESDGPSYLYSIDARNGAVKWKTPRKTRQAAYTSPVAVAGHESVMVYDLDDGRPLWTAPGLST